ncbi:uncharacterized protein EMH_0060250 [Eimeria mitis]|uniref:Uncharacterized protein n=1 Tax=Eimeria mitis TaxID=44415 RepID=U6K0Y4_9EIME|nr:uncharacterized protein EMH_0060250 [Eimeria mitis]CDJ30661.1 hypothetical protein, conserved [Eimeria mitis]
MLAVIDLALVQQQPLPPLPEYAARAAAPMDVDSQAESKKACAPAEPRELQQQQVEMQTEVTGLEPQQQEVQQQAEHSMALQNDAEPAEAKANEANDGQQDHPSLAGTDQHCSESVDLFAPAGEAMPPATHDTGCADATPKETKPRGRAVRGAAKRRPVSRRRRVLDD